MYVRTERQLTVTLRLMLDLNAQESSSYCLKTGMKVKVLCIEDGKESVHYISCSEQDNDQRSNVTNVVTFQIIMAIAGGLAYWGVTIRKKLTMSQFDLRSNPK